MTRILLVGPDNPARKRAEQLLLAADHRVELVSNAPDRPGIHDIMVADATASTVTGRSVLDLATIVPLILLSEATNVREAVTAIQLGASDYLTLPLMEEQFRNAINRVLAARLAEAEAIPSASKSEPMQELIQHIRKLAPTECAVLIQGEFGTGKEQAARAIHAASRRHNGPFVCLNCATVPSQLLEAELFGDPAEGTLERSGLLETAAGGTLFLDEVSELTPAAQTRLLAELGAMGDDRTTSRTRDVRIIAATHHSLDTLVAEGRLREELYYRLNVVSLIAPPLRERGQDVLDLADAMLAHTCKRLAKPKKRFTDDARRAMLGYAWPGNVRELGNAIERAVILSDDDSIDTRMLAIEIDQNGPLPRVSSEAPTADQTTLEDYFVSFVLANQDQMTETELAEKLGISRKSLWERRQRLNIPRKRTRKRGPRRD